MLLLYLGRAPGELEPELELELELELDYQGHEEGG